MYRLAVAETDFGFGGMHVHIHQLGGQIQKQRKRGRDLVVQHIAIRLLHRVQHHFIAHKAVVYKEKLLVAFALRKGGLGNKAAQRHFARLAINRQGCSLKRRAHNRRHALAQRLRGVVKHCFVVVFQRKRYGGVCQRQPLQHGGAMRVFGVFGFQKLAPRRRVEKQLGDFNRGADWVRGGGNLAQRAIHRADLVCVGIVRGATGEREPRHGCDARQPFAAKPHAFNVFQIG